MSSLLCAWVAAVQTATQHMTKTISTAECSEFRRTIRVSYNHQRNQASLLKACDHCKAVKL
jgi:hypothetical protein